MNRMLLACLFVVGCSSDPAPLPEDAGPACVYPSPDAGCASCVASSCCAEIAACDADPVCRGFSDCVARCAPGDSACAAKCRVARPSGYGLLASRLATCVATHCDRACGTASCGGYIANDPKCGECTETKCCAQSATCLEDTECATLLACERACDAVDGACLGRCERAHPTAVAPARALGACVDTSCVASCLPPQWRCLDTPKTPAPAIARTSIQFNLRTQRFADGMPWEGVTVRACSELDYGCTKPLAGPKVADATGYTLLEVPGSSFNGYFEITGAGAIDSIYFVGRQTEDGWWLINLVDQAIFAVLTTGIAEPNPEKGHFIITAGDCRTASAPGVAFSIDPQDDAVGAYLSGGFPTVSATETDATGWGGFINVRPETGIKIHAKVPAYDRDFPVTATVFTHPGWITYVNILPYANK